MKGFSAKSTNRENQEIDNSEIETQTVNHEGLSDEIEKLDNLLKEGVLTQEEFEKAKKKILEN